MSSGRRPISPIVEGQLYLGDRNAAADRDFLKSFGITHVVNAASEQPNFHPDAFEYYNCNLRDLSLETIDFEGPLQFMQEAISAGGVVFVHCMLGKSRSASLVIAYVMRAYGMSLQDALERVHDLRPCARPNSGFMRQLREFEASLFGSQAKGYSAAGAYPESYPGAEPVWQAQAEFSMEERQEDGCTIS